MNGSLLALGALGTLALGAAVSTRGSRSLRWRMEGRAPNDKGLAMGRRVRETVETMELPFRAEHYGFPAGREAASTLQDLRDFGGFDVTPIGMDEEEAIVRVERVYPASTLLHIRRRDPGSRPATLTLSPRVPQSPLPGEDTHTPRVSLAPRLGGALLGLGVHTKIDREERPWDVYANVDSVVGVVPSFLDVPDKDESGEVWSLAPVPVVRIGAIAPDALWRARAVLSELVFRKYKNRRTPWTPAVQDAVWTAVEESVGLWRAVSLSKVRRLA